MPQKRLTTARLCGIIVLEIKGDKPMDFKLTWEQAVFFQMLLIMYKQGELDMEKIEKELIEKMGEERYKKSLEKIKKSLKNA